MRAAYPRNVRKNMETVSKRVNESFRTSTHLVIRGQRTTEIRPGRKLPCTDHLFHHLLQSPNGVRMTGVDHAEDEDMLALEVEKDEGVFEGVDQDDDVDDDPPDPSTEEDDRSHVAVISIVLLAVFTS